MLFRALVVRTLACGLLAFTICGTASAQGVTVYRPGERVDPSAVARILGATTPGTMPAGTRTRGLQFLDTSAPGGSGAAGAPAALNAPAGAATSASVSTGNSGANPGGGSQGLSLPVQFGFDSTVIFPEAREQLDAVAAGIKMIPRTQPVVIEGHTDATGDDAYNLDLSKRRAESVKQYLVGAHGIDPRRLRVIGQGKRAPIDPVDPYGPVNRRVQFRGG